MKTMKNNCHPNHTSCNILKACEHPICPESLPDQVIWILNRLRWAGHIAYIVGGGVRDLLLQKMPKDFDLVTNATPKDLCKLFLNSRIIGKRFRIVHIYFRSGEIVEVTTFRKHPQPNSTGLIREDNLFGSPKEDAWRRDITINGLFYDHEIGRVIDYVDGLSDLRSKKIRTIGEPNQRFREDPVRMLRAMRHASRLHFSFDSETWQAIQSQAHKLKLCPPARTLEEFFKDLRSGNAARTFEMHLQSGLMRNWLPHLSSWLKKNRERSYHSTRKFGHFVTYEWGQTQAFWQHLQTIDAQIKKGKQYSDITLLACLLLPIAWNYVFQKRTENQKNKNLWHNAFYKQLHPITHDLKLHGIDRDMLAQVICNYWRIHIAPSQPKQQTILKRCKYLREIFDLIEIEILSHNVKTPKWLPILQQETQKTS